MIRLRSFHHADFPALRLATGREQSVSVVVPTRNCAGTIGDVVARLAELKSSGVIDEIIVVDADSADGTAELARRGGADVHSENALMAAFGTSRGKGDAMWRSLSVARGDVICFVDGDTQNFGTHFVTGLLGPLLCERGVHYVKGFFKRPLKLGENTHPQEGGRVTELTARPLLRTFWPELAAFDQPLAGEMAARRELFARVPFSTGYAIETALLIDIYREVGVSGLCQVDLELRQNSHQPLAALAGMADEVLSAITTRLVRERRLTAAGLRPAGNVVERPPMSRVAAVPA